MFNQTMVEGRPNNTDTQVRLNELQQQLNAQQQMLVQIQQTMQLLASQSRGGTAQDTHATTPSEELHNMANGDNYETTGNSGKSTPPERLPTPTHLEHQVETHKQEHQMRSESRTDDTSGLVTTMASSAKYSAIRAPCSIPAGESQII